MTAFAGGSLASIWDVFLLFSIPIGGGIPAGVVLGQGRGVGWVTLSLIYLVSDIVLALYFEPLMHLVIRMSHKNKFLAHMREALKESTKKTISGFGSNPGPLMLVVIAFGVDPMTGRAAALAAGHNFFTGWAIAIAGDMIFFGVVMASTIWLNNFLGDGTMAAVIIMVAMLLIPAIIKRVRKKD